MLKKQTVWLLTMLSLMVVLSIYYMMSDHEDIAYIDTGEESLEQATLSEPVDDTDVEIEDIQSIEPNELFTTIRMEVQDERSMKKDRLKEIVASGDATADEINEALSEIDEIDKLTSKETILQESILASKEEYEDVLVRTEEDKVHVHVITDELTKEEANNIMQMVRDELGTFPVDVNFQPVNG